MPYFRGLDVKFLGRFAFLQVTTCEEFARRDHFGLKFGFGYVGGRLFLFHTLPLYKWESLKISPQLQKIEYESAAAYK